MARIAWGITGCGDKIEQISSMMTDLKVKHSLNIDLYASKSGEMVLKWYKLWDTLKNQFSQIQVEVNANTPFLAGKLQTGHYDLLLLAPTTANTVAKIANGIADTLITNAVSQAAKAMVPVYIYPVDSKKGNVETILPDGKLLRLQIRDVDVENVAKLRKMEHITVLENAEEIEKTITDFLIRLKSQKTGQESNMEP
jgi:archaeoflavoprotein AfpA